MGRQLRRHGPGIKPARPLRELLTDARGSLARPGTQIALDTAITAGINAALLILGSRYLSSAQLGSLTMVQLFASSAVILQRASLLSPGLAARRSVGQSAALPISWMAVSVPVLSLLAALVAPLVLTTNEPYWQRAGVTLMLCGTLLSQDFLRYTLFSRNGTDVALKMDALWLIFAAPLAIVALPMTNWMALTIGWSAASMLAALCTGLVWRRRLRTAQPYVSLRDTLKLGRWSGLDNSLSIFSNILPMAVTALALATPLASTYRILQTALGPLNIINTTLVAAFGLNSHKLTTKAGIVQLSGQVRKSAALLSVATAAYTAVAFALIAYVADIEPEMAVRVGLVLGAAALLGATTTPFMAAASALGYQIVGVGIRVVVVILSATASWMAARGGFVPWDDPIGVVAVGAAFFGLIGWLWGYGVASRREKAALEK